MNHSHIKKIISHDQVERELHKHEVLREKERKVQEDQKREQDKELERQRQRQARERSIDAETNVSAHRNKYSREALRAAAAAESKKEIVSSLDISKKHISKKHTVSSRVKRCNQSNSKN